MGAPRQDRCYRVRGSLALPTLPLGRTPVTAYGRKTMPPSPDVPEATTVRGGWVRSPSAAERRQGLSVGLVVEPRENAPSTMSRATSGRSRPLLKAWAFISANASGSPIPSSAMTLPCAW